MTRRPPSLPPASATQCGGDEGSPPSCATLIIGLGNPLRGDDGVGVRVAQILGNHTLPDGVEVLDGGTQGLGIVNLMEGRQRVILVDAAEMGRSPGEFVCFARDSFDPQGEWGEAHLLGDGVETASTPRGVETALTPRGVETALTPRDAHLSVHAAGLRDALALAEALQMLPPEVIIFGVQPLHLEWESALSPPVEAALPDLVAAILAKVESRYKGKP